ncbi:MAG: hypothetical protein IT225_07270 [Flavobacteriales bacterium]|jgi:gliding motility-associated lipoprotein GldD|nr:hypothetical protein [Flavobacteriales bacterium]
MRRPIERILAAAVLLTACTADPVPKPRGYFRIDLPEQTYRQWTDSITFEAALPTYAQVGIRKAKDDARWFDIRFKGQRATAHLTWSPVNGQLQHLIEDAHTFKSTHQAKAARIRSERLILDSTRVFGTLFDIEGDVASPFVFYVTDSTHNFLYGSLYFDNRPNGDSLAPVTERLRSDLRHMLATLRWR